MKVFISYSINDMEQYIITLLSYHLKEKEASVTSRRNIYSNELDFMTSQEISSSQLFIGIVTSTGKQWKRVISEWEYAVKNRIPVVLLVEDNVRVQPGFEKNCFRFNREQPTPAIEEIKKRMNSTIKTDDSLGWILAGAALIALIALLSDKK